MEIEARGTGTLLVDFISMMLADLRKTGMMRPDLVEALDGLKAPFIRWPGGSFASIYLWKDGIRTEGIAKISSEYYLGWLFRLLWFRNRRVHGTLPAAEDRTPDCLAATSTNPEISKVCDGLGTLP